MNKNKRKPSASKIIGQSKVYNLLQLAADNNMGALIIGETGTGKTSIVQDIANTRNQPWTRFNLTGDTTVDDFVGKYTLLEGRTVWEDGILLQAMKKGHWLIVDEINVALPEILFALHSLLDDDRFVVVAGHDGEIVRPHEDFRFFATMNPVEEYAGTKNLNKAFKSRFGVVLEMTYPSRSAEIEIVHTRTGVDKLTVAKMVDIATQIRKAKKEEKVFYTCSTRDLIHWGTVTNLADIETGFTVSVLNKAMEDRENLIKLYDHILSRYTALDTSLGEQPLSVTWFEEKMKQIDEHEATFEERVKAAVQERITKAMA